MGSSVEKASGHRCQLICPYGKFQGSFSYLGRHALVGKGGDGCCIGSLLRIGEEVERSEQVSDRFDIVDRGLFGYDREVQIVDGQ